MKKILFLGILTLIFKDITLNQDVRLVMQILTQSQRVENLVMREGKRNHIVYEGLFEGEAETLVQMLGDSIGGRFKMEVQSKEGGLEIILQPPSS